ncbi:uncharacterized protein LOC102809848 [Saccoglossus kowalevskii]
MTTTGGTGFGGVGHGRSRKAPHADDDEEEDPVETLLDKTGCAKYHYAVQDCMFENKDWRKCQAEVNEFRQCIMKQQTKDTTGKKS